jgi:hypothetical protein
MTQALFVELNQQGQELPGESTLSSQLSTEKYLQHLWQLAEGKPELEERLRQVEGLIAKDRGSRFRGRRGSLIYQSIDGD